MKNECCNKIEQKSSCGDIEVGLLWKPYMFIIFIIWVGIAKKIKVERYNGGGMHFDGVA